jgi:DNA invertase Pin-like site-specific DNA recombinase
VPDARDIGDGLATRGIKLSLGGRLYDPTDSMGKMFFNIMATFAEFGVDVLRMHIYPHPPALRYVGLRHAC